MIVYLFGLISLAICTGFLVAQSLSPTVSVLLPLLFSLVGGTTGAFFVKSDPDDQLTQTRITQLGWVAIAFFAPLFLALYFFTSTRYERIATPIEDLPGFEKANTQQSALLISLRRQLILLGATPAEQRAVLINALSESEAVKGKNGDKINEILQPFGVKHDELIKKSWPSELEKLGNSGGLIMNNPLNNTFSPLPDTFK